MSFYENKIFPPVMEFTTRVLRKDIAKVLSQAEGRVLEIGAGTGANFQFYGDAVSEVVSIEPVATMVETARRRTRKRQQRFPITVEQGDARQLPFDDHSFDSVVACLVYCTIPDPHLAAAEMHRVLKPQGKLVFFEHVASKRPKVQRWQQRLNPLWKKLACGCEITRSTRDLFEQAGFSYAQISDYDHPKLAALMAPLISGVAHKQG